MASPLSSSVCYTERVNGNVAAKACSKLEGQESNGKIDRGRAWKHALL